MANIGLQLESDTLVLTKGRDFHWVFENLDENDQPVDYPDGELFFEFQLGDTVTTWDFVITGSEAEITVESDDVDDMPPRTTWQLVFLPDGEASGGYAIATGTVYIQGAAR